MTQPLESSAVQPAMPPSEARLAAAKARPNFVLDFFGSFGVRFVLIAVVGLAASIAAADFGWQALAPQVYAQLEPKLTAELSSFKKLDDKSTQEIQSSVGASWCYITRGKSVISGTLPANNTTAETNRQVVLSDRAYYELLVPVKGNVNAHFGFYLPKLLPSLQKLSLADLASSCPLGYWAIFAFCFFCLLKLAISACLLNPLKFLPRVAEEIFSLNHEMLESETRHPLACTEVQKVATGLRNIRLRYDEETYKRLTKEHDLKRATKTLAEEKKNLEKEFEEHRTDTQRSMSELSTKEAEDVFLDALGRELDFLTDKSKICQRVFDKLNDKFPQTVSFGAGFTIDRHRRLSFEGRLGLDDDACDMLKRVDLMAIANQAFLSGQPLAISIESAKEWRGLQEFARENRFRHMVFLPLIYHKRNLGIMAIFFETTGRVLTERQRMIRRAAELMSRTLYGVVIYQEQVEDSRVDALTGMYNKKFLYEAVPHILERTAPHPQDSPTSFVIIDGDHFKEINDTYGHQFGDLMLKELSNILRQSTRARDEVQTSFRPKDYLIRYGGEEFVLIMEKTDSTTALAVAERIRHTVASKTDWPGGVAKWTISMGVATYPFDGNNVDECLERADNALYYVKKELGRNKVIHCSDVPKAFRTGKFSNLGGELGVFDPAALLQSLATSQKTGILTVQSPDQTGQLWMMLENGKPTQARLGKLRGKAAVVEFVSTFEDGKFNFSEIDTTASNQRLAPDYNIERGLERCLMEAALARDNFISATKIITDVDVQLRPVADEGLASRWQSMLESSEPPTTEEIDVMNQIVRADRNLILKQIFNLIDDVPRACVWRCAALLVTYGIVEQIKPDGSETKVNLRALSKH